MNNSTTNTIAESKDQIIERLQEELKRERSLYSDIPKRPVRKEDIFKDILDLGEKQQETKSDFASFRRSLAETSYSIPTAEAIPVIESESAAVRQNGLAFQEIQKENLRLQAQLTAAAKERETFVFLQEENKKLRLENLRLSHENKVAKDALTRIALNYDIIHQQFKQSKEVHDKLQEFQPALQEFQTKIDRFLKIKAEQKNLLLGGRKSIPIRILEDKEVQTFSESEIAQALLKSQPKRLRFLK